ncbi:flavodoxin family protein [Clostridium simiarum]|nr:NAD(P)H-dependent oxidoreductase [Clostridium simiarum]
MGVVCMSASNIKHSKNNGTSIKACKLVKKIINKRGANSIDVEIISLVDYDLKPCIGCGECFYSDNCVYDNDFNHIYSTIVKADALFIVSAHYAPIPAKLSIFLEKVEQLAFLKRFNDENYRSPLFDKPVGLICHGGGTEELIKYYKSLVLDPIYNALSYPVEMKIIGVSKEQHNGVAFPVKSIKKIEESIFPVQEYDWNDIENRLEPLVDNVIKQIKVGKRS